MAAFNLAASARTTLSCGQGNKWVTEPYRVCFRGRSLWLTFVLNIKHSGRRTEVECCFTSRDEKSGAIAGTPGQRCICGLNGRALMEARCAGCQSWFPTAFDMQNTRVWVKIEGLGFLCPWGSIWRVLTVEMFIGCNCSAVGKLIFFLYNMYHGKVGQRFWSYRTGAPCWPSLWKSQRKM